jgi:hypothetical protein
MRERERELSEVEDTLLKINKKNKKKVICLAR